MAGSTQQEPEKSASAAAPLPSKRARILKRTLFGTGLGVACAAILWFTNRFGDATPLLIVGSFVALLGMIEASLMGTLFLRALPVILIVPLVGVTLVEFACIQRPPSEGPWAQLALEILVAISLAALVHALTRGLARFKLARQLLILALCAVLVGAFGWLDEHDMRPFDVLPVFGGLAGLALLVASVVDRSPQKRLDLAISVGLAVWIGVPLPALAQIDRLWGVSGVVSLILLSKIGDVAGYYVGNAIGRSHPFPSLSPGKTTAGCVSSFIAGVAMGAGLAWMDMLPATILNGALVGAFINIASQAGDLFESWVKRRTRVKDSSSWLGPSGGVLDVVDSLLFSVPTALVVWPLFLSA
ncbi:MAG TPA: phosphatidate cytidylyltransferase [Planctomycetota bacterium]|nr:phosphatidate cytidylyltransferase [Planctomycetota bacterium]